MLRHLHKNIDTISLKANAADLEINMVRLEIIAVNYSSQITVDNNAIECTFSYLISMVTIKYDTDEDIESHH